MAASRARQAATPSEATPGKLDRCARLPIALYSKDTLIQTASGKYHVGFDLSDHKDPAHNRDHTTNEFGKIKTLNIGAIPFANSSSRARPVTVGTYGRRNNVKLSNPSIAFPGRPAFRFRTHRPKAAHVIHHIRPPLHFQSLGESVGDFVTPCEQHGQEQSVILAN